MSEPRKLKKSETLEIRLPHPTKAAFMAQCRAEGVSASEAVRAFIDQRLEPRTRQSPRKLLIGALIAAAVGAAAAPSLAGPSIRTDLLGRIAFARIDSDRDGVISPAEFRRAIGEARR